MNAQTEMALGAPAYVAFRAPPPPFVSGSETSREAAASIKADTSDLRAKVFACIQSAGAFGRTDEEIQTRLSMGGSTERPRRRELQISGRIRESAMKRKTSTGRLAVVWVSP